MMAKVSFIGLGIMGTGMVGNLVKAGHEVTVWNRTSSKLDEIKKPIKTYTTFTPTRKTIELDF